MIGLIEPAGVGEVRRAQMQRGGFLVHESDEARPVDDAHRERLGRVVAGVEHHAVDQLAHG